MNIVFGETFNHGAQADGRFFHFCCGSQRWPVDVHKPSTCSCHVESLSKVPAQLPSSGPPTEWKTSGLPGGIETKCLHENPLFDARLCSPGARRSFGWPSVWQVLCYRKSPLRTLGSATQSAKERPELSELCPLLWIWQKVKLSRGLPSSC